MDELHRRPEHSGGSVKPQDGEAPRSPPRAAESTSGLRFELRDPFAEVTHRSNSFSEMVAMAEQLGALRFVAIDRDGQRIPVAKDRGQWLPPSAARRSREAVVSLPLAGSNARPDPRVIATGPAGTRPIDARAATLERELNERYVIKRPSLRIGDVPVGLTEYRLRSDTSQIAFRESASKLSAETNAPSVVRSMIDVAEMRQWRAIRVSGSDEFKRLVWLEASLRNLRTLGYEPNSNDRDRLRSAHRSHGHDRPLAARVAHAENAPASKQAGRGGSRKAVLAAIEAILVAKRIPPSQRDAVMAAAAEGLARRVRNGDRLRVKVYDRSAPSQRSTNLPPREVQRAREHPLPGR